VLSTSEIFTFEQRGVSPEGYVIGDIVPTGVAPRFLDKLRVKGIRIPPGLFTPDATAQMRRR
jgi:pilus assembly protein CpaF